MIDGSDYGKLLATIFWCVIALAFFGGIGVTLLMYWLLK